MARCQISQSTVSATPQRRIREVNEENILQSSAVKLCVMDSSQFFKKYVSVIDCLFAVIIFIKFILMLG